jgi:hypothetical protein
VDFDASSLVASLVVSGIGFVAFNYGRKQSRLPQLVIGLALMGFPYFVSNTWLMAAIAGALLGLLWLGVRLGL